MKQTRHIHIYLHFQYEPLAMNNCMKRHLYIQYKHIYMIILSNFHCIFHIYIEMHHSNFNTYSIALQIHTYIILDIDTLLCTMG